LLPPTFAARSVIRPVSRPASVWWYREGHAHFLRRALRDRLAHGTGREVVYAQCPVSARAALEVCVHQPVVMVAHFNISQADEWAGKGEIPTNGAMFRSIRSFEERVLGRLDAIVHVSAFTRNALEDRIPALRDVPTVVIPNSVAMTSTPDAPTATGIVGDLITVGTLEPRKNHAYLLEVLHVASLRGHRYTLTIVGDGPERQRLESTVRRLGLADQVTFQGYRADARALMAGHRMYCHTATMESFGIVLVEAMAEGLPVLAGAVGGIPEVFRAGREGAFWPLDDASAAADVLVGLMEDTDLRRRLAAAGRAHARAEFSADALGRQLLAFLDGATARASRNRGRAQAKR
jgi:glycosyltransferase involved in cell wall biosynthesis